MKTLRFESDDGWRLVRRFRLSFRFRLTDIEVLARVRLGVETVGTLRVPVDDGVEPVGDHVVDDGFEFACLRAELLDVEDVREEALDDAVGLKGVAGADDAVVGERDTLVLLVLGEAARLQLSNHLVRARRTDLHHVRECTGGCRAVFHLLQQVNRFDVLVCRVHRVTRVLP